MSMCVYRTVIKVDVFSCFLPYLCIDFCDKSLSLHLGPTNLARLARQQALWLALRRDDQYVQSCPIFDTVLKSPAQVLTLVASVLYQVNQLPGYNHFLKCSALSYSVFILPKQTHTCLSSGHHSSLVVLIPFIMYHILNTCRLLLGIEFIFHAEEGRIF